MTRVSIFLVTVALIAGMVSCSQPAPSYTLTIASTTGGTVTPGVGTHTYDEGTVVNLTATPGPGYHFVNWTGNVSTIADVEAATTNITMNGSYNITANFEEYTANQPPNNPSNIYPANGATDISLTPTLQSSAFSDPNLGDTHSASQWQTTTTSDNYTSPVFDSGTDTGNLTSITISFGAFHYSTTYYWHVRYRDNHGAWSDWSAETSFTTTAIGLVSWWKADGDANDSCGSNNGTLVNGATFGPGVVGQAFQLDGIDDWVMIPSAPNLNFGTGDFTVSLWVNFADPYPEQMLIEKFVEAFSMSGRAGWTFTKLTGNVIRFAGPLGDEAVILDAPASIIANTWHFAVVCRSGSTYSIYWDGTLIGSTSRSDNLNLDSDVSLKIGHRGNPDDTPGSVDWRNFYLKGLVDEVQIYNRALSSAEIATLANGT